MLGISNGILGTHPNAVTFGPLVGAGAQAAQSSDSWIQENPMGMIPGLGVVFSSLAFPNADGSSLLVK